MKANFFAKCGVWLDLGGWHVTELFAFVCVPSCSSFADVPWTPVPSGFRRRFNFSCFVHIECVWTTESTGRQRNITARKSSEKVDSSRCFSSSIMWRRNVDWFVAFCESNFSSLPPPPPPPLLIFLLFSPYSSSASSPTLSCHFYFYFLSFQRQDGRLPVGWGCIEAARFVTAALLSDNIVAISRFPPPHGESCCFF